MRAHEQLDDDVAAAYGRPTDIGEAEISKRLLELNLDRAADQEVASGDEASEEELLDG